jgi:hypothetical protein
MMDKTPLWFSAVCFAFVIGALIGANCDSHKPFEWRSETTAIECPQCGNSDPAQIYIISDTYSSEKILLWYHTVERKSEYVCGVCGYQWEVSHD